MNNRVVGSTAFALVLLSVVLFVVLPPMTVRLLWFDPAWVVWLSVALCALGTLLGVVSRRVGLGKAAMWTGGILTTVVFVTAPRLGCPRSPQDARINRLGWWGIRVTGSAADGYSIDIIGNATTDKAIREGFEDLKTLHPLKRVFVKSENITSEGICVLANLPEVESMHLDSVTVSRDGLECLSQMAHLRTLGMRCVRCRDDDIAGLAGSKSLENLFIDECAFGDTAVEHIARIKTLHLVQIVGTVVTREAIKDLETKRPDLKISHW